MDFMDEKTRIDTSAVWVWTTLQLWFKENDKKKMELSFSHKTLITTNSLEEFPLLKMLLDNWRLLRWNKK